MNKTLIIIALLVVIAFFYFVWKGVQIKFRLPAVAAILKSVGIKQGDSLNSTVELFQIGIGSKNHI